MAQKGNKGEWSEIYTLFKVLSERNLFLGDKDLEKAIDVVYPVLKVLRNEEGGAIIYQLDNDSVVIIKNTQEVEKVPIIEFEEQAASLLAKILEGKKTFSVLRTEQFMRKIFCESLKAKASEKKDISIVIHDPKTKLTPTLGFSIKSQLGSPSTLLNAGKTTNFVFEIVNVNLSDEEISVINSIGSRRKIQDRISAIKGKLGQFIFLNTEQEIFASNLILIDSRLPEILAAMVLQFYSSSGTKMIDLLECLEAENPLQYNNAQAHKFYEYKIKHFLTDVALGMMPSKVWSGRYDATGGYLIVKRNGEVLCYHIYDRNIFEDYLVQNTKLETASTSRHEFGKIYKEDSRLLIKLNLQIRFLK